MKIFIVLIFVSSILAVKAQKKDVKIVCYYASWSMYYQNTPFDPTLIDPFLCTHLIYAFGTFRNESELAPFDEWGDIVKGGYANFTGLKKINKNLKTLLSIGGRNEGSRRFSSIAIDPEKRENISKNAVSYLRQYNFDGLDLAWNYPAVLDGSKYADKENYVTLAKLLREEFEKEAISSNRSRLLLSIAVPCDLNNIDKGFDIPELNKYVDWMNVLSYGYHSAFELTVNHHAALYPEKNSLQKNRNINFTIDYYLEFGAIPQKLVLGIPTYGQTMILANSEFTNIGSISDGPGDPGSSTRQKGSLAYFEICQNLMEEENITRKIDTDDEYGDDQEGWRIENSDIMGPYAFKGNQWISYDDIDTVKRKAKYVADNSLGGIMIWTIDLDDFLGKCHGKKFPLIDAAKTVLYESLGLDIHNNGYETTSEKHNIEETTLEYILVENGTAAHSTSSYSNIIADLSLIIWMMFLHNIIKSYQGYTNIL